MRQLDLFGMPVEYEQPLPVKKGKKGGENAPPKIQAINLLQTIDKVLETPNNTTPQPHNGQPEHATKPTTGEAYPINFNLPAAPPLQIEAFTKGNVVFENSNISVKIRAKNIPGGNDQPLEQRQKPRPSILVKQPDTEYSLVLGNTMATLKNSIKEALLKENLEKKVKQKSVQKLPRKRGRKSLKELEADSAMVQVPDDELLFKKQYYPISEVAKWFNVNTSLLRFWENEFDILKPRKNRKGDRLFRPEDVKNLQLIYQLLRQQKFSIEGAKDYLKTNKSKAEMQWQLVNTLQQFKGFLLEVKAGL